jgi:hypothetical protein
MAGKEITITGWETKDVRFPTSLDKTGSDAMNTAGDYSAAYCILQTDSKFSGHGMVRSFSSLPACPLFLCHGWSLQQWPSESELSFNTKPIFGCGGNWWMTFLRPSGSLPWGPVLLFALVLNLPIFR